MRAWTFQDHRQKKKLGDKAPWSAGWVDPEGGKRSKRIGSKSMAEKYARKKEGELAAGLCQSGPQQVAWEKFRKEYETKVMPGLGPRTREVVEDALNNFQRLAKPARMSVITTKTIDAFRVKRLAERGKKKNSTVAPATVNREMRHIKAVLRIALEYGYITKVPKFRWARELTRIGRVITPEHFQAIYTACNKAAKPASQAYAPGDWWQALLVFALTTGWRIDEILSLRRDDLDLETGAILTRAADNKGKRDDRDYLTTTALEHVRLLAGFQPLVFYWPHDRRTLDTEFHRIQGVAGINLPCRDADKHECTDACHRYGFHSLRRGYATLNADTMTAAVLQKKMRHRSFQTTLRYISLSDKMKKATESVYVPEFLQKRQAN
jgi:integrase